MSEDGYVIPATGGPRQAQAKAAILDLLRRAPKSDEQLIANLALYTRSVLLAKTLYLDELYRRIVERPGVIMEFGVWWGSNLASFCSLRSVYEPYNWARKVIGFDTFEGYPTVTAEDGDSDHAATGGYAMPEGYEVYLEAVLDAHERDNVMEHVRKFELVKGDVERTLEEYLARHPETVVALAYMDLAMYEPTKRVLELLEPHLVKGAVIALDELGSARFPGETRAFKEVFGMRRFRMSRSKFLPDRTIVEIE